MTGAVPVAIGAGNGAAASGTYLLVGLILLVFSVGYTRMSREVTNAGAFFAYVGRGLGRPAGVGSAFASLVGYITIQLAIYGFFGGIVALTLPGTLTWYGWAIVGWVLVTGLSLLSVDVGAKVLGTLMVLELLSLVIMAVAILINGGPETVGIIASVTRPFCGACDRLRLTADGQLRSCLFATKEMDLRDVLRSTELTDEQKHAEIASRFDKTVVSKLPGHGINDPSFIQPARPMSAIGG